MEETSERRPENTELDIQIRRGGGGGGKKLKGVEEVMGYMAF
jgi:hypothetical protein